MGQRQTESSYQSEAAYLKSVLLWLQEYWTGPAPRFYPYKPAAQRPYKQAAQRPSHYSVEKVRAALNRQDAILDLPTFLPSRTSSQYR
jgi:hypothetical protein